MKVAVIGVGKWGKNLARTFHELGALGCVVEASESAREDISRLYPEVKVFERFEPSTISFCGAVAIATPVTTHFELALQCINSGFDTFVEKPMTFSKSQAEALARSLEGTSQILMVGHLLLYQPAIQWIKRFIDEGKLGTVSAIYQSRLGFGKVREAENALQSLGVHDLAVLLYLNGSPIHRVTVNGNKFLQPQIEDDVHLKIDFEDGVSSHLRVSWLWPKKERGLTIIGTAGMLVYEESSNEVTLHRKHVGKNLELFDEGSEVVFKGEGEPLRLELEHFLNCVSKRIQPISDVQNGVRVMSLLETIQDRLRSINDQYKGS